jgi:hypothetical protein
MLAFLCAMALRGRAAAEPQNPPGPGLLAGAPRREDERGFPAQAPLHGLIAADSVARRFAAIIFTSR